MKRRIFYFTAAALLTTLCSCNNGTMFTGVNYDEQTGKYSSGNEEAKKVELVTLKNQNGMEVSITNYGGRIVSLLVPDKQGEKKDVVLGFDKLEEYFPWNNTTDFGASIGRYANRLNHGRIVIEGDTIQLPQNNFGHCLHGGFTGWQYQLYDIEKSDDKSVTLVMNSKDGDNNFPGNVVAKVTYTLTDNNAVEISYEATTDKETVINMTNHSYFNLHGDATKKITDCMLTIDADNFTPVDSTYMTTGEIAPVEGTPMDFRTAKQIGQDIENFDYEQLKNGNGYDHNWVLNTKGDKSKPCVRLECEETGIILEVFTSEPGIQVYTGNFLDGTVKGKKGITYEQRTAVCLETQKYPDSPNKQWAESNAYLKPGEKYTSYCKYQFSIAK